MVTPAKTFNPFPGLRPFESHEHHLFFGRDGQSDELLRRLRLNRFLAVVGTSGSGKSSLMRAGMLPALHRGFMAGGARWHVALMRPGADPLGNLAQALDQTKLWQSEGDLAAYQAAILRATLSRSTLGLMEAARQAPVPAQDNLLVVVDQFEELFRFKKEAQKAGKGEEAAHFIQLLLEASRQRDLPIFVVLTMRSDLLGDCAQFRDLPEAINDGQYLIPRMNREQRRAAIASPVAVAQGQISERLVNRLLNDVGDDPDQLPILQHALMRAWDYWQAHRHDNEPLDLRHYEDIGGMKAALSQHADEAHQELRGERSRLIAERMFKCLTEKGPDNREIRRPTKLSGICAVAEADEAEVIAVIERFRQPGRTFLMPPAPESLTPDTPIDISHESLIRNWQRLKDWVEEEARSAESYKRVAETAVLHGEGRAGLWGDPDLQEALNWKERQQPNPAWAGRYHEKFEAAMAFLDQSAIRRRRQREQRFSAIAAGMLAIAVLAVWFLWGSDTYQLRKLHQPLQQLQQGLLSVADFDKKLERAKERVSVTSRLDEVRQAFLAVLLDSMETAICKELNRPRAESYLQTLLKNLPMAEKLPRLRKIGKDYYRRVKQPGIGLTPAIYDTVKTWLDLAYVAFERDSLIAALLTDLKKRNDILDSLQVKIPRDKRFLIGDVPQRNVRLKIVLQNPSNLQGATVFLDEAEMPFKQFDGQPHRSAFKTFSSGSVFVDSTITVRIKAVISDSFEVTRPVTFVLKKLRSRPKTDMDYGEVVLMINDCNFHDESYNRKGSGFTEYFDLRKERFLRKDSIIVDRATGLMWQRSGSQETLEFEETAHYVAQLNAGRGYAGYRDWRLPTLEEAMSLMEREENSEGIYIDPVFDGAQRWIWTADRFQKRLAWVVSFHLGYCSPSGFGHSPRVRAVRAGH